MLNFPLAYNTLVEFLNRTRAGAPAHHVKTLAIFNKKKVFLPRKIKSGVAGFARRFTPAELDMRKGPFLSLFARPDTLFAKPDGERGERGHISRFAKKIKKGAEKIPRLKIGGPGGD